MSQFECNVCIKESPCNLSFAPDVGFDFPTECPFAVAATPIWEKTLHTYKCKVCGEIMADVCSSCCELNNVQQQDSADVCHCQISRLQNLQGIETCYVCGNPTHR